MAKKTENQAQPQADATNNERAPRFNESLINWSELEKFGLSKDKLQASGSLQEMMMGGKTSQLIPIRLDFGPAVYNGAARLSFRQSVGGPVVLNIDGINKTPDFDLPYFGHIFSKDYRENLLNTGNLGRVVELNTNDGSSPHFISFDRLTREFHRINAENYKVPDEINKAKIDQSARDILLQGAAVLIDDMIAKSGKTYSATVQVSAMRRGLEMRFDNNKLFNLVTLGGVKLDAQQSEALNNGKAILVEDMVSKTGNKYSKFVKLDETTGRPVYLNYNPYSPENAREIIIPKELGGVTLTYEDRLKLSEGKTIFVENMLSKENKEYSKFVKVDLNTGQPMYADRQDGFSEKPEFKIPKEIMGVKLTGKQYGALQEGKAVQVNGIKGFDGKTLSLWFKPNLTTGTMNHYNENTDQKQGASQRNIFVVNQPKAETKQENKPSRGPKL